MIRYESVRLTSTIDLLTKIESFLGVCGWELRRENDKILFAKDSKGGALCFCFLSPNFNYTYSDKSGSTTITPNCIIYMADDFNASLDFTKNIVTDLPNLQSIAHFEVNTTGAEFNKAYLIADSESFALYIDNETKWNLFFTSGHIAKTHEFNGGRVAYSSMRRDHSYFYGHFRYFGVIQNSDYKPFSDQTKTLFSLGGEWNWVENLKNSKVLTNFIDKVSDNQLSALSAVPLLNVGKSALSGLYTMITPNFFYLNNQNIFVHAGDFDFVRVLNTKNEVKNGQILHLGDEKFMILCPYLSSTSTSGNFYAMAVKIA